MGNLTVKESGEMINFISPNVSKITSFKVHFSPKQEGSGDPSPENVREITGWNGVEGYGCGKNLFNIETAVEGYIDSTGKKISSPDQENMTSDFIPVIEGETYTWTHYPTRTDVNYWTGYAFYSSKDMDSVIGKRTVKNTLKPIYITVPANAKYIRIGSRYLNGGKAQLEKGSIENVSYEPYQETIIPIDFTNNYLNKVQITNNKTINSTGEEITESGMSVTDYIPVNENEEWFLYFVSTTAGRTRRIWGYDENKQPISEFAKVSWATVDQEYTLTANITSDVKYIKVCYYTNDTDLLLSIDGTSFKNVYGGYVDLVSGELVEDISYKQITAESLSNAGDYIGYTSSVTALDGQSAVWVRNLFNSTAKGRKSGGIKANCNAFKVLMNSTGVSSSQNRTAFAVDSETITSVADFISAVETLEQNGNGLYLAYELATPIIHQLTPQQLSTLKGQNNFWSNADYVEIEYELTETFDIQKAKRKIIFNQPHVEMMGSDLISLNADMKAPLKECKVYFSPVQEGSGDPSPDNVRNITGWNGVSVGLPSEYQKVEYIENSGKSYLKIPYTIQRYDEIETKLYTEKMGVSYQTPFSNGVATYQTIMVFAYDKAIYVKYFATGDAPKIMLENIKGIPLLFTIDSNGLLTCKNENNEILGTAQSLYQQNIDGEDTDLYLFIRANKKDPFYGRYYGFKITNNNNLCLNLIPCYRKFDNEIGMYDTVSKQFFTNQGTDTFLKGADVNGIQGNIDWTDSAGTIYGGYVDLISGELVVNMAIVDLGTLIWTYNEQYTTFLSYPIDLMSTSSYKKVLCSQYRITNQWLTSQEWASNDKIFSLRGQDGRIRIKDTAYTDASAFKTSVDGVQFVYELANPIYYQFTPQQLIVFKGTNNIFSDSNGTIDIKFWTHNRIINYLKDAEWLDRYYITSTGKLTKGDSSTLSHVTTTSIYLPKGRYNISGFCNQEYVEQSLNCRVHEYDANDKWVKLIANNEADFMRDYFLEFSLDHDSYIKLSLPRMLECKLIKLY